jgi:hypothetical protein
LANRGIGVNRTEFMERVLGHTGPGQHDANGGYTVDEREGVVEVSHPHLILTILALSSPNLH